MTNTTKETSNKNAYNMQSGFDLTSFILRVITHAGSIITFIISITLILFIVARGLPSLNIDQFALEYNSNNSSMLPSLVATLEMTALSLLISIPFSLGAAIFLSEYGKRDNKFIAIIRIAAETLAGIPSIIYGLFGMILFVVVLGFGYSLLAGVLTLSIMTLPLIMRTSEEALISVSMGLREGSYALGAGKLRTIFRIVLPSAIPGILAGIILAIGRVVGETAALIFTAGAFTPDYPDGLFSTARTLSVHMYTLASEGLHTDAAYAASFVLLVLVFIINTLSMIVANMLNPQKRLEKQSRKLSKLNKSKENND